MNAVVVEVAPENSPLSVSEIMARLFEIRAERKELSNRDSELVEEWEGLEATLIGKMDEQGSVRVSSRLGTASISEQTLPLIEDWDAVYAYIKDNDAFHLLQRRAAVGAYRELVEAAVAAGQDPEAVVPGARPITKRSINLRAGT